MAIKDIAHKVASEDETLTSIADQYGLADWNDLFRYNRDVLTSGPDDEEIKDMNLLPVGLVLKVPDHEDHALGREELIKRAKDAGAYLIGDADPRWINPIERVSYTLTKKQPLKEQGQRPRDGVRRGEFELRRLAGARIRILDPDQDLKQVVPENEGAWLELDFRGSFKVRLPRKTYKVEVEDWDYKFPSEDEFNRFFDWTYLDPPGGGAGDAGGSEAG